MTNFIISLICCAIPDSLYITLFIIKTKDIKNRIIPLYLSILVGYILFIMLLRFNLMLYLCYIVHIYVTLKILYKVKIPDIFIIIASYVYLILCNVIGALFMPIAYNLGLIINKVVLFMIFIFSNKLNKVYINYLKNWNRHNGGKIKSITLRNISLFSTNIMLIILDVCMLLAVIYFFK